MMKLWLRYSGMDSKYVGTWHEVVRWGGDVHDLLKTENCDGYWHRYGPKSFPFDAWQSGDVRPLKGIDLKKMYMFASNRRAARNEAYRLHDTLTKASVATNVVVNPAAKGQTPAQRNSAATATFKAQYGQAPDDLLRNTGDDDTPESIRDLVEYRYVPEVY